MNNIIQFTCTHVPTLRAIKGNSNFSSAETRIAEKTEHHAFSVGDRATLVGLESFPEYNGEEVVITNIRENCEHGRAYYIKGRISEHINWVYEYRLRKLDTV